MKAIMCLNERILIILVTNYKLPGMKKILDQFNDLLADKMSLILSTMFMFWLIFALTIIPLFYSMPNTPKDWAQYLCTVIFQGVALPVLGYTARKAGDKTDKVMEEIDSLVKQIDEKTKETEALTEKINNLVMLIEAQEINIQNKLEQILDKQNK